MASTMNATCDTGVGCLLDLQQSDGGWAYGTNSAWTEPTAYAILALRTAGGPREAICRGSEWLCRKQRRDGGWSPGPAVEQSTHVSSLAVLALSGAPGYEGVAERGVHWLLTQAGAKASLWARLARLGVGTNTGATDHTGWPWYPGAAAWVIPTSLAICALSSHRHGKDGPEIDGRIAEAQRFLMSRRCPDQGWNHGGLFGKGETPVSYPETTGIALLALAASAGVAGEIEGSIRCGEQHARNPKSSEGANWLHLGLAAHGRMPDIAKAGYRDWTVNQMALRIITEGDARRNPFISHV
jgi:hypothetical protein